VARCCPRPCATHHPESPRLAIGAIDESGKTFVSDWAADLGPTYLEAEKTPIGGSAPPPRAYTPLRAPIDPRGRIVIVVDDGIATGSTT
jgi:predicted phosphoribosyltransferase